jgi:hypothetical protein
MKIAANDIVSITEAKRPYLFNIFFYLGMTKILQGIKKILNLLFKK